MYIIKIISIEVSIRLVYDIDHQLMFLDSHTIGINLLRGHKKF